MSPGSDDVEEQAVERIAQVRDLVGSSCATPPAVASLSHEEKTELSHDPDDAGRQCRRDYETRDSAQGRFGDGDEGILLVALAGQLDGLEGANIAGDEGEDGDTNAALHQDSEEGKLQ